MIKGYAVNQNAVSEQKKIQLIAHAGNYIRKFSLLIINN